MDRIQKVNAEVKSAIQRKSAYTLPNNPTDSGWKANDIRKAFWQPIIDNANSAITEIDRVVDEVNGYLNYAVKGLDSIVSVAGSYYHSSTGLIYTLSEEGFVVSGYEGEEVSLAVPAHIYHDGQYVKVVGIAGEAFKGKAIEHIEIPETVGIIGDSAFASCMKLATVVFKGESELGSGVFGSTNTVYTVPKEYLTAYQSSLASYVLSVENQVRGVNTIENNANDIAILYRDKLYKITTTAGNQRVYTISTSGAQITRELTATPKAGEIPLYNSGGRIKTGNPLEDDDSTPRSYVESRLSDMGAYIAFTIDPTTYKMTLQLKNESGQVLSSGVVDLPLESMILGARYANGVLTLNIKTADGSMNNTTIDVNISDLISGLVNEETFEAEVERLDERIDDTNIEHQALVNEVAQKEIYAHAAFHSEEAETARNFTKGGKIDKKFREIEAGGGTNLSLSLDSDYKLTVKLLNKKGVVIASGMVDLPIESLITKASYSNKILTLTFQSGDTLKVDISSIVSGLVPDSRKINGHALTSDVLLSASDVGAYGKEETYNKTEVSNLLGSQKQEILVSIEEHQIVGYAYMSAEAEKASGFIKGGAIDKEIKALKKEIATLKEGN